MITLICEKTGRTEFYMAREGDTSPTIFIDKPDFVPPPGMINMVEQIPNPWCVAQADGTWLDTPELQAAWEAAQSEL